MRALAISCILAAGAAVLAAPAGAQLPDLTQPRPLERTLPARPVEISVSYSLMIPVASTDIDDQRTALEQGRRALYEIASNECQNITATIATTCQLARMNVQSNMQRGAQLREATTISATASYHIQLKPALNGGGR